MKFEKITHNDLEEIRILQPEGWSDIIPDFKYYIQSPFCNPIKTKVNDKIVGIGASIVFDKTSWLVQIIVDPNFRRRGIGQQIVEELLKKLEKDSIETCSLVATELGQPIYTKLGFRVVTEYYFMKKENPWKTKPVSKNVIAFQEEHRSIIYSLDKRISGENRRKLLDVYIDRSKVYVDNNEVLGFYIPGIREGPIFADTEDAGLELMNFKYSNFDKAVLPPDNVTGIEFLKRNGFVETDIKGTRMILGKDIDWKPEKIYSRIGGNLG